MITDDKRVVAVNNLSCELDKNIETAMASKEVWTTSGKLTESPRKSEEHQETNNSAGPNSSTPKAGPKSWKRKVARAREEKSFAHVDDLLMSDSDEESEDCISATDNLNETETVANTDEDMSTYSDEFEIDDLGK